MVADQPKEKIASMKIYNVASVAVLKYCTCQKYYEVIAGVTIFYF